MIYKWSRRKFITSAAGAGAALLWNPVRGWTFQEIDPRVATIVAGSIGIDTHNHIDVPLTADQVPGPAIDLAGEMKKSGLSAICMTIPLDYQRLTNPGEAYDRWQNAMACYDTQLENNKIRRSLNLADLRAAHAAHQPTVVQSVEGGHFLEGRIERVGIAYDRGLRHFGLLHDSDASTPLGDVYTNPPRFNGLTPFGTEVIRECNRLGILVDLAHASNDTIAAALKVAAHPPMISHTGLDWRSGNDANFYQLMRPRLISKEEAKVMADAGGVVGVWTHLADNPVEYAQNLRALVDVIGVGHVCIGTDTKLTQPYRAPRPGGQHPPGNGPVGGPGGQDKPGGGPAGPGGPGSQHHFNGERTNLAWKGMKLGFYYAVVEAMLKIGFNADEIGQIGGGNFCRLFDQWTAGKP